MSESKILLERQRALSLYDEYGALLTSLQKDLFSSYFLYDLSLAEIAEEKGISRAAVSESLAVSLKKMESFEKKLGLVEKNRKLSVLLAAVGAAPMDRMKQDAVRKLIKELKNGL